MRSKARLLVVAMFVGAFSFAVPTHVPASVVPDVVSGAQTIASSIAPGARLSTTVTMPWRTNLVGVSFLGSDPEAEGVEITMRAFDRGAWTDRLDMIVEPDEAPDAEELARASKRVATLPQWVGRATRFDISITSSLDAEPIHDVRLDAINTTGDAFDVPAPVRALRAVGRFLTSTAIRPPAAQALTSKPSITTRAQWGANESWRTPGPGIASYVALAFIHHTVNSNSYSRTDSPALIRSIYRYHTSNLGYSDIAYNFLVDRYGQIFEGRYGGVEKAVIGGHTGGFNTGATGIALLGTFTSASPPTAMISSLKKLLAWKLDIHHVPAIGKVKRISGGNERYDKGTAVWFNRISGHRDASSTSCPGSKTYALLPSIRTAVDAIGQPKIYLPSVEPSPTWRITGIHMNGPFRAEATFSRTVSWRLSLSQAGAAVRSWPGTGTSFARTWDGRMTTGTFIPSGTYDWKITATYGSTTATPAAGRITINSDWSPPFYDDEGSIHEANIDRIAAEGITTGCGEDRYCPLGFVQRGAAAAFIDRLLDLPPTDQDFFTDDEQSPFEASINRLAAAQITTGCDTGRFCPTETMSRAEMASFLARALELPPSVVDHFSDDNGLGHEQDINRIADAGISNGCGPGIFCPSLSVDRAQMASFLARALDLLTVP
jgi:hypothetical protein